MKSPTDNDILYLVIATGIASVVTQLYLIREYLAQFQGNEIVIALVLFNWLVLGGVGTRLAHQAKHPSADRLAFVSFVLAGLAVFQVMMIRFLRQQLLAAGASVGFYTIWGFSLFTMAPYALLVGWVLPYSLFVIRRQRPSFAGVRLYMTDNLGDVCGGALFAFVLIQWASPMQALLAANLPLVITALRISRYHWYQMAAAVIVAAVLILGAVTEERSLRPRIGQLLHYQESRFARLTVHQDQGQNTLFADGRPLCSTENIALAEEMVHYPLSQLTRAKRILMISSAGGMTTELSKYNPKQVDYIELDPVVTQLLLRYKMLAPMAALNIVHADARAWLQGSDVQYDAIMINLPEPDTFQLNRFYTHEFFELAKSHLTPHGIFSFTVEGYANYITAAQRELISSLWHTAKDHFPHVAVLPAGRVFFLCRQDPIDLDIPGRLAAQGITTRYVGPFFKGNVSARRIEALQADINPAAPINTDTRPYVMRRMFQQWFEKFGASPRIFLLLVTSLVGLYVIRLKREAFVLFTTGWMTMGSEVLVIFAFQIFLGYIYLKIGILVTVFLAGLLPGAWLGQRSGRHRMPLLLFSDLMLVLLLLLLMGCLLRYGQVLPALFYFGFGFAISLMCGFQFPLALARLGDSNISAARLFAVDLVGAACGTLVTSTILIPYLGLSGAIGVLMGIKALSMALLGGSYVFH